jgi:hypothetical protein
MLAKAKGSKLRSHKLGANRNELATKKKKLAANFSQSKDIWEDRSVRQRRVRYGK